MKISKKKSTYRVSFYMSASISVAPNVTVSGGNSGPGTPTQFVGVSDPGVSDPVPNPQQDAAAQTAAAQSATKTATKAVEESVRRATPAIRSDDAGTPQSIRALEKATNLTLYPYFFGGELARIKHLFSDMNDNKYYLLLNLLVYGFDSQTLASSTQGSGPYVIDQAFINEFFSLAKNPEIGVALRKTPAWAKGSFDDIGKLGITEANADHMANSPITGPTKSTPSLVERLLNTIHPDAVENIEKFCNIIRTRAYLSLPKGAFGALGRLVAAINGVVAGFQKIINDIYNGIIFWVQKFFTWINGLINEFTRWLLSKIEEIIPLDLICLILDTLQFVLDDINFFTSLFNMSGPFINVLNTIQTFVNTASNFASNPIQQISAFFPPEVNQIINAVNQLGTDAGGFIADQLSNYGYAWVATALQGNLIGALVDKFGPQYAAFTPLGNILSKASAIYNRYGQGATFFPPTLASLGPNIYNGGREDLYGNPVDPGDIIGNVQDNFTVIGEQLQAAGEALEDIPGEVGGFFGDIGRSVSNLFGNRNENTQQSPESEQ